MTVMRERAHVSRERALNKTWSGGRRDLIVTNPRGDRLRITPRSYASADNIKSTPRTSYSVDETTRPTPRRCTSADVVHISSLQRSPPGDYTSTKIKRTRPRHYQKRSKTQKVLLLRRHQQIGFGFSIRGGIEHGTGIFISSINKYADAAGQGLQVGDQILKSNNRSFAGITHEEAVNFIQSHKTLRLVVLSIGVIPGTTLAQTEYQWNDCYGKPCSPLLGDYHGYENGVSERKVNVVVGNNSKLGLLIRGGSEYGLGIFVAGIDEDSVADRSGIMVGEQIHEVNGISFLAITHTDAAHIIRTSKMMTMLLRDVGKVPVAKIVLDQTEWVDRRSVASDSQLSLEGSPKGSIFQPGIAGSQLNHQSTTGLTPYRWIEDKAQQFLTMDDWSTLKYYIREYVHGHISVNGLVLSLFDLLETKEKLSLLPEIRGIVRAQDIDTYDEMVLRKEVEVIKVNESSRSKKPYSARKVAHEKVINSRKAVDSPQRSSVDGVDEEEDEVEVEEVIEIPSEVHQDPSHSCEQEETFAYKELHDQSTIMELHDQSTIMELHDQSTIMDNMTEESMLCTTPHLEETDNIMDDSIPDVNTEPIYAVVDHSLRKQEETCVQRETSTEEEPSTQQGTSAQSDDQTEKISPSKEPLNEEVVMIQSEDVQKDVNVIQEKVIDELKCHVVSAPNDVVLNDKKNEARHNKTGKIGNKGIDKITPKKSQNELGYAFSFLNSNNGEAKEHINSPSPAAATVTEIDDKTICAVQNENIRSPSMSPPEEKQTTEEKNEKNLRQDPLLKINCEDLSMSPASCNKQSSIPESDSDGYQSENGIPSPATKPNNLFPPLDNERTPNMQDDDDGNEARKIRNYQPKFLVELNRFFKENTDKTDPDEKVSTNDVRKMNYGVQGNFNTPKYDNDAPSFDATPSMEHRYANFSVNDILRQNYLPLTRLDHNSSFPSVSDEQQKSLDDLSHGDVIRKPSKLSSLNIQNQYQYESSERNRTRSLEFDEVPKIDDTKSFGKPVMSRKTDLLSTSWEKDHTKKKINEINLNMMADNDEIAANDKHSILNPKLRKTKNSELILGIKTNDEDDIMASEDFIKATSIAQYLSSDQSDFNEDTVHLPQIKSKIPIFENNAMTNNKTLVYENEHLSKQTPYEAPNPYLLDADFRATDELENTREMHNSNSYFTKVTHTNSFTDFRSTDDDEGINIHDKTEDSVDDKILSIKSRIEAFSKNGGIRHLQKEIERLNGNSTNHAVKKEGNANGFKRPDSPLKTKYSRKNKLKHIKIPIESEEPGFQVDNRIGEKGNYIYVSEIKDPNLTSIGVDDVIAAVDNKPFQNGMKKGLANLMIKNAFKCTDRTHVLLTVQKT